MDKFDCLGQGYLENEKIGNIIKINESEILTNIKNNCCIIYERKNEIGERLKKTLIDLNKNENEIKEEQKNYNDNNIINTKDKIIKKEKNINFVIQKSEDLKLVSSVQRSLSGFLPQQQLNLGNKKQVNNYFNSNQLNNPYQYSRINTNQNRYSVPFQGNYNFNFVSQNNFNYQKNVYNKNNSPSLNKINKEGLKSAYSPYENEETESLKEFLPEANKEILNIKSSRTSRKEKKIKLKETNA